MLDGQEKKNYRFFVVDFGFGSKNKSLGKPSQVGKECFKLLWQRPQWYAIVATDFLLVYVSVKLYEGRTLSKEMAVGLSSAHNMQRKPCETKVAELVSLLQLRAVLQLLGRVRRNKQNSSEPNFCS